VGHLFHAPKRGVVARRKAEAVIEPPPRREPPKPFVDQASVVEYFRRVGPDKLAHAYLFHGPRGVGKKTFAHALALTLHCEHPLSFPLGYCGECSACRRGFAGTSGDVIIVDDDFVRDADALAGNPERKTADIGIEASRRIIQLMQMKSYEGGRMIAILPDFESVTGVETYNALLKELEEPDPGKLFLITTERPEHIIDTIRSRTVQIRFESIAEKDIADQLMRQYGQPRERAQELARRAQGSLGEAIAELEEGAGALRKTARQWLLACLRSPGKLPPMPELEKDDRESARRQLDEVLRQARLTARDVMVTALGAKKAVFDPSAATEYQKTVEALGASAVQRATNALDVINEASRIANTNVAPATTLGWLQIQLRSV
jgi:DNA polymerase III subunit delta'